MMYKSMCNYSKVDEMSALVVVPCFLLQQEAKERARWGEPVAPPAAARPAWGGGGGGDGVNLSQMALEQTASAMEGRKWISCSFMYCVK